ncbi:TolC family protein [Chitinophaga horti]|uniref:TolC family protein n=1 Tax=Chitinophaga horti TaxID=2920382 RepID=A0ABY6IXQ0_9BACT|nr:TolC family protein [Chitinophaga horti]UYQ92023.1 TolC family protein [Chitinophaga horti]
MKLITTCFTALLFTLSARSQQLTLPNVIMQAQKSSPSYYRARSNAMNSLYTFRYYVANRRPQLRLTADNTSSFLGNISSIRQPDGSYAFNKSYFSYTSAGMSLDQIVPFTGGTFSLETNLQRNDLFRPDTVSFLSTPFSIRYSQPMILYNPYKWDKKISPLLYEESTRRYVEDLERAALEATGYFFDALTARQNELILQANVANTDTLYKISKGRYELGKIAENELLQIELNLLNAQTALEQAQLSKQMAYRELTRFLNMPKDADIDVIAPADVPQFVVVMERAVSEANTNRQAVLEFRRRRIQAERDVAEARGSNGYQFNMQASLGQSQDGATIKDAYAGRALQQNQLLSVGVSIPIVDWGKSRYRVKQAKANAELVEIDVQQQERSFEQEVFLQTQQFNIQKKQLASAAKADTIAAQRYEITKQRYLIGKISITDLNLAQQEKNQASQGYVTALRSFWNAYYTVRVLTLYDFERNERISYEFVE